jgi:hypothetical protein
VFHNAHYFNFYVFLHSANYITEVTVINHFPHYYNNSGNNGKTFGYVTYATRRVKSEGCNIIFSSVHTLMCSKHKNKNNKLQMKRASSIRKETNICIKRADCHQ